MGKLVKKDIIDLQDKFFAFAKQISDCLLKDENKSGINITLVNLQTECYTLKGIISKLLEVYDYFEKQKDIKKESED